MAIAKGYYADENLDVEVVQPPEDGADALVGTGKAQVGMSYQDVMANYLGSDDQLPVTAIAATIQHNTSGIMSRAGEGIDRPKGMEGKRYGTWDQDVEKAMVKSVVETDGGDFSKVQLVPSGDEVSGLKSNQFDCVWGYEGWGLQNAKLIVNSDSTLLTYQHFKGETFHSVGIGALLTLIGVLLIAVMLIKNVKGAILYGIILTWVLGIICELTGIYVPDAEAGMYSVIPTAFVSFDFSSLGNTFGQVFNLDFTNFNIGNFIVVMFAFLFVDLFDTLGTLIGVASKADMLDEEGKLPRIKGALLADAIATSAGAVLGTSTTTTYVESASGVTEGGRTGLTAATTAVLFLLASIFSPLFLTIPSFATAPALIVVGFYMMGAVVKINFDDMTDAIPAFLTILVMPLAYSISEGIAIGVVSWTLINLLSGKAKEKKITPLMYVLTVLFILKYIFL